MSMAGRQKKTQSSTGWRPIINGTKANVVLEKHTIQYNIQKKTQKQKERKRQSLQKRTKVENCSYAIKLSC